jgi:protein-S-isoprenylcysteine O-methyltransferase Ste14
MVRLGGWLFRHRTLTPVPLALALLIVQPGSAAASPIPLAGGIALVAIGEALRLWSVRHIGAVSRTRSDRLGPLVASGPFAFVRNPLYLGNLAVWIGFTIGARLSWLVPVLVAILGFEYHAIVRWEERLLEERLGEAYRAYAAGVPRWIPTFERLNRRARRDRSEEDGSRSAAIRTRTFSWRETLFSERGTLVAIAVGYALLYLKEHA